MERKHPIILLLLFLCTFLNGQEDCLTAVAIPIGSNISVNNIGSLPDNDYSALNGCPFYSSAVWYSFTTPAFVSSINFTITTGTLGSNSSITILENCMLPGIAVWSGCDATLTSGVQQTICNLVPGTTYYIQIASDVGSEGTFTLDVQLNPTSPVNDICEGAIDVGILECLAPNTNIPLPNAATGACPDPEGAQGTMCMTASTPAVWYKFTTDPSMPYSGIAIDPPNGFYTLFKGDPDCSNLIYTWDCFEGYGVPNLEPGMDYYILLEEGNLNSKIRTFDGLVTSCAMPATNLDTGSGTGGIYTHHNSCVPGSSVMPCQNTSVVWFSYTVGCADADITIDLNGFPPLAGSPALAMDEGGISAFDTDCMTLLAANDPINGTGYVCSAVVNNEQLALTNLSAGTQFVFAVGSEAFMNGWFQVIVTEEQIGPGLITNDNCNVSTPVILGCNPDFTNNCATQDLLYPSCPLQSEATVWFSYIPTMLPVDLTINVNSMGISSPAIAAYDGCGGPLIGEICGSNLILSCLNGPINIQVGSGNNNTGGFDLDISESPALPPILQITSGSICSYEDAQALLEFPAGVTGDINVVVSSSTSSNIMGQTSHDFTNVNSAIIDDVLVNCGTSTEQAIYTISYTANGFSCPSMPIDLVVMVYPKLEGDPYTLDICLPDLIAINADTVITGGIMPYQSYNWLWNGTQSIGSVQFLDAFLASTSGFILLEVVDANGCMHEVTIDVIVHLEVNPIITSTALFACQGNPAAIVIEITTGSILDPINFTDWTVLDQLGNPVSIGVPSLTDFVITTQNVVPGVYTISTTVLNDFGCSGTSNIITIEIFPTPNGIVVETIDANCESVLNIVFYGPGATDIYNNGPDSNGDGIPDQYDLDNNGILDFTQITWQTPNGDDPNGIIEYTPTVSGFYGAQILTDQNCLANIIGLIIDLIPPEEPSLIIPTDLCQGDSTTIMVSPMSYVDYEWYDQDGNLLGVGSTSITVFVDSVDMITLQVLDANGCMYEVSEPLNALSNPEIEISGSTTICPGSNTTISVLEDPGFISYQWWDGSMTLLGSDSSSLFIDTPGEYFLVVTNDGNCKDSISFMIEESAQLAIQIVGGDICLGDSSILDAGPDFDSYQWSNDNGEMLGDGQTLVVTDDDVYIVVITKEMCSGTDSIEILVHDPPAVDIIDQVQICNANNSGEEVSVDFNELSSASDPGGWTSLDLPMSILVNLSNVDFSAEMVGFYQFVYTTDNAMQPCLNISDTLIVEVINCDCPNPTLDGNVTLCNSELSFDLDDQLLPTTDMGNWNFLSGPEVLSIQLGNVVAIENITSGLYEFEYQLDPAILPPCISGDTLQLEVIATPEIQLSEPISVCNAPSMQAPTIISLSDYIIAGNGIWQDPMIPSLDFSDPSNLDFTNIAPGNYSIDIITSDAITPCVNVSATLAINVLNCACPIIDLQPTLPDYCIDLAIINLNDFIGISDPGQWMDAMSNPLPVTISNGQIELTNYPEGTYQFIYVLVSQITGCPVSDTTSVTLFEPPIITSTTDTVVCNAFSAQGDTWINLNKLIEAGPGEWSDENGEIVTDPTMVEFENLPSGSIHCFTYTTNTAMLPCSDISSTIKIEVIDCSCDNPVFLDPPILCNGIDDVVNLEDLIISNHVGEWTLIDQPTGAGQSLNGTDFFYEGITAGTYTVRYILDNPMIDCPDEWIFDIGVVAEEQATLSEDLSICSDWLEESYVVDLDAAIIEGAENGFWMDQENNVLTVGLVDFQFRPEGIYTYTYSIDNEDPCSDYLYAFEISIEPCEEEVEDIKIYVPNSFSPNDDQINDVFFIQSGPEDVAIAEFLIFDRWGERVFFLENGMTNDPMLGWDGKFKNQIVVPGVYIYLIKILGQDGNEEMLVGNLTILR